MSEKLKYDDEYIRCLIAELNHRHNVGQDKGEDAFHRDCREVVEQLQAQLATHRKGEDDLLGALEKAHEMLKDIPDWPDLEHEYYLDKEIKKALAKAKELK